MLEFSQFEAGYIISQKELEAAVGYRYQDNPENFDYFLADIYSIVQKALEQVELNSQLKVYPALDFKGFVILNVKDMTEEEKNLYHIQRDRLLKIQAKQDIKRSEF
ncbi:MAG: hypothetical protein WBB82_12735 [Limnothrix sp.]